MKKAEEKKKKEQKFLVSKFQLNKLNKLLNIIK